MPDPIAFDATIARISTAADGGYKLTLDVPEVHKVEAMAILGLGMAVVKVEVLPVVEGE